jgi:hypothetical protein
MLEKVYYFDGNDSKSCHFGRIKVEEKINILWKSLAWPMSYVNVCKIGNIYLNTSGVFDLGYTLNKEKILTFYVEYFMERQCPGL